MAYSNVTTSTRIEALSKDNYDTWKIQVQALMVKNDTWGYVSGDTPAPTIAGEGDALATAQAAYKTWLIADGKAKADLILSISPSEIKQIRGCITSKEVWDKLESIYASKGPARKATLLKRLTQHKMQEGEDVRTFLSGFFDTVDKLESMDVTINGELLAIMLLYSLPSSFENFRCAIESRDSLPDVELLKIKIIEEFNVKRQNKTDEADGAMFVKHNRSYPNKSKMYSDAPRDENGHKSSNARMNIKCGFCGKKGHKESVCFTKRRVRDHKANFADEDQHAYFSNNKSARDNKPVACAARWRSDSNSASHEAHHSYFSNNKSANNKRYASTTDRWCLDSGCTTHLCKDKTLFVNAEKTRSGLKLASHATAEVKAKGDVKFTISNGDANESVFLKDTLYVPDLRNNLISIAKIVDRNHEVTFKKNQAVIKDAQGNVKLTADRVGDLFYLGQKNQEACFANTNNKSDIVSWHERLGHLNYKDLVSMKKNQNAIGLKFNENADVKPCKTCIISKQSSKPFPKRVDRSENLLDIVHTDLCGPIRTKSKGGASYFMTFIDDHSRMCNVYFLRDKSEAVEKFVEYKNHVETQTGRKIKAIQSDNGTEFCNKKMDTILRNAGIRRRLTTPYTPQQNGAAERKNRSLVECARCMLIQSGLPASFWAEAVAAANHIKNRCITKSLKQGTPYEQWTGKKPNVKYFKTFGCKVFVLNKTPNKGKFERRSVEGIFVGYSETSKAYRIWIPEEGKIRISRDVKFLNEFHPPSKYEDFYPEDTVHEETTSKVQAFAEDEILPHEVEIAPAQINHEIIDNRAEVANQDAVQQQPVLQTKRGPGRPKKIMTGKRGRPKKRYNLIIQGDNRPSSSEEDAQPNGADNCEPTQASSVNSDPETDDDNVEWFETEVAMNATEIPLEKAISGSDRKDWEEAIKTEIRHLIANDTWELVKKRPNTKVIGSRIVLRNKYQIDGTVERRKARVVARGFSQRAGIDFLDTFAPVARLESFRLLMALSARYKLKVSQLDVTTAFLNGEIDTLVYMEPPEMLEQTLTKIITEDEDSLAEKATIMLRDLRSGKTTCRLKKALYGLRQGGRQWYAKLDETLRKIGLQPTVSDPCIYVDNNKQRTTIILVYVDDILIASNDEIRVNKIKRELSRRFEIRDLGPAKYCLGFEIEQNDDEISLSQKGHINDVLRRFNMQDSRPVKTPLAVGTKLVKEEHPEENEEKIPFRELIGALMYIAVGSRPDIAHAVNALSQFNNSFGKDHWVMAKRILRYLKGTVDYRLNYRRDDENLICYADADWGNCVIDRRSYTGYAFILSDGAISWNSRKQRTVALSSTEAEYMCISEAAKEALYLIKFLTELGFEGIAKTTIFNDNQGAGKLAQNPVHHARSKHIDIKHHFIRHVLQSYPVKLEYLSTDRMVADIFTKALPESKNSKCVNGLGLIQSSN